MFLLIYVPMPLEAEQIMLLEPHIQISNLHLLTDNQLELVILQTIMVQLQIFVTDVLIFLKKGL